MIKNILLIVLSFRIMTVIASSDNKQLTYIWNFNSEDSSTLFFSDSLRIRFESTLRECKDIKPVCIQDSIMISYINSLNLEENKYSLLFKNKYNYLIDGDISNNDKENQLSVSIKLFCLVDSENVSSSSFNYSCSKLISDKRIDLIAMAIVSEICPTFNISINRLSKAEKLFNLKNSYLDNYKKMVDSLLESSKTLKETDTPDTIILIDTIHDTIIKNSKPLNINVVDVLIPGYGLFTSFKNKNNIFHSLLYNVILISSSTCGTTFLILSEQDLYLKKSDRLKIYGTSLIATSAFSSVVNGIVVAIKLKHQKMSNLKIP